MNQSELSPIERAIAKKIDKTKNKANQPGYLRKLVAKLHLRIEAALEHRFSNRKLSSASF